MLYIAGASCDADSTQIYKHIASYSNILNSLVQHTTKPTDPDTHPEPSALALQVWKATNTEWSNTVHIPHQHMQILYCNVPLTPYILKIIYNFYITITTF